MFSGDIGAKTPWLRDWPPSWLGKVDWKGEAAAARKRLAAAGRAPDGAYAPVKTVLERLREGLTKNSEVDATTAVPMTFPRPEHGRVITGCISYPKRPVEPVLGPFWVDHHGQKMAEHQPRVRAALNQIPENTALRAEMLAKRREQVRLREQDEAEHIQEQNAFRVRRAKREAKWKALFTATQVDDIHHGREPVQCASVCVRSFF